MGRELKRVALDFVWPEYKVWHGFINPHSEKAHECPACNGRGETVASQRLGDLVSLLMLSGSDAANGRCHPYLSEAPLYATQGAVCGPDMTELTTALAGRELCLFGHDSCDRWEAKRKIIAASGLPETWGTCQVCQGDGTVWDTPEDKQAAEEWTPAEPPAGEGFQIWETVSEGSPISPVFSTAEALARHMAGTRWGTDDGSRYETWLRFITGPGWAPSMVMDAGGIRTGAAAAFSEETKP